MLAFMEDKKVQNLAQEIKPIQNPSRRNYLKISLPLAGMVLLLGAVYLTVNNALQQQQDNRSQASLGANMVANSGFESGTGSWQFNRRAGAGTYTVTTSTKSEGVNSAQLSVTTAASNPWDIELAQYGKAITAGQTYTVSFWARAASSRSIEVVAQDSSSPYREYMRRSVPLTTAWTQYTYTFVAPESKSNTFVGIQVGKATGTVYVDNVVYAQGTGSSVVPTVASTGNILSNPGCENGTNYFKGYQANVSSTIAIKRSGNSSCQVVSIGGTYYDIESLQSAANPAVGQTFTGSAYVRAATNTNGRVYVALRERGGSASPRTVYGTPVYLTTEWQLVQTTMTIQSGGRTDLDYYVIQDPGSVGQLFFADDMVFKSGTAQQPTAAPTAVVPTATTAPTATKAPTPTTVPSPTTSTGNLVFTINKSTYAKGENMTVYWSNIPNATPRDWIGLYTPTAANGSEIGWIYVNCTQTATVAVASGQCTFPLPDAASGGSYELRLHPNEGNTVLAKSPLFNITGTTPGLTLVPTATIPPTNFPTATGVLSPTATTPPTPFPTATVAPGSASIAVNLFLHGVGKGGDAVNPGGTGNMSPLRPQRTVTVDVYDVQNQLVLTKQGTVTFNATLGNFTGNIDLGSQFNTGLYTVKVKTDQYLRGLVGGIQTITQGQSTNLASLTLVAGDVNNDNAINIVDYNIIVGCYSDLLPPVSCNDVNNVRADINDDGKVNQFDYNLFIRELTNLGGQ
jgi:hypothetical protein